MQEHREEVNSNIQAQYSINPISKHISRDTPISLTSVYREYFNLTQGKKIKIIPQILGKINKRTHNLTGSTSLRENPKSDNNIKGKSRYDRSGDHGNAEQRGKFSSKNCGGLVSELINFGRENYGRNVN